MNGPIQYPGGKGRLLSKLLPLIPEHKVYCEPCGGGASLLFAKKPSQLEIYNDLHEGVVSLFRVLRDKDKFKQFTRMVYMTPYSRQQYLESKESWDKQKDEIMTAYHYFIHARQGFVSGQGNEGWSYDKISTLASRVTRTQTWLGILTRLPEIHTRLLMLEVEKLDFEQVLNKYDGEEVFFYIDPPYYNIELYKHNFSDADHERLILACSKLKAKVLLSNYRNDLYNILDEIGWKSIDFITQSSTSLKTSFNDKAKAKRVETVWMNYHV